ncbi:MAG: triose-phosphate isomerase [Patescibacteria group bacterium]|jgi:triosephosphate isomerase
MDKKIYLFANWKMYLNVEESVKLAKDYAKLKYPAKSVEVAVFPSSIAIESVKKILQKSKMFVGPQNTFWADKGGYTGEVSSTTYKEIGCTHALVGHAERRHIFKESNHDVRMKLDALLQLSLTPVLCVGETAEDRKKNETAEVLEAQIRAAFMDISWPENITPIIAYEPVWAVGTGESCEPGEAEKASEMISNWTEKLINKKPVILYGGSVRGENIGRYLERAHISGVLVGGASAKIETWSELVAQLK